MQNHNKKPFAGSVSPDLAAAARFLNLLDPTGQFVFQVVPEASGSSVRPKSLVGSLETLANQLCQLNTAGAAVFVQINAGSGRKDVDVERVRAYFVDLDGSDPTELLSAESGTDMLVESSLGKYHGYWLAGDEPLSEFKARQQALADRFGGDRTVCNLARVMRLPGFIHQKGTPFMSRIHRIRDGL